MQTFLKEKEDYSLISADLPLIYNLNVIENISLIKEVHDFMPSLQAQAIANDLLSKVGLSHIEFHRVNKCSVIEVFYVMFLRALMSRDKNIFIEVTHSVVESLRDMKSVFENINLLKDDKNVFFLDLVENEDYYKGTLCNIIK